MATYFDPDQTKSAYIQSKKEAHIWREDYPAFERLMDNGLLEGLDINLPEVNDGSLAAALFKLPKRIVSSELSGRVKALDRDEAWLTELANLQWENNIIPNANSQAPFHRKWKDAVRKAAGYGSVPLVNLFVNRGDYRGSDFIVAQPQDVTLEAGKVSDYDSDIIFWDVYYTEVQLKSMIQEAKAENKASRESDDESYNKWNIAELQRVLDTKASDDGRDGQDIPRQEEGKDVRTKGFKFYIAFQRGVDAPFRMHSTATGEWVREWSNPDPTGDMPVHFLYCYQDFINPYGIGIVKLAGGTQNVLDYMRQADVLATQLGLRPPINIAGDADSADIDSLVYAQDALWFTGNAVVKREELASGVYNQLPGRIQMYKTSLNQLIPTGDTSASSADTGDPTQSKTPAGVKLVAANLSIDDEDFKDNLYMTYSAVAKSMINVHFANMEGSDLMKLSDDERDVLMKSGLEFPENENGEMSNELEIEWDTARATFDFEVDPEQDKTKDEAQKLEGLTRVFELISNPATMQLLAGGQPLMLGNKKLDPGELIGEIISLTTHNDKIITDVTPDEQADEQAQMAMQQQGMPGQVPPEMPAEAPQQPMQQDMGQVPQLPPETMPMEDTQLAPQQPSEEMTEPQETVDPSQISEEEMAENVAQVMQEYGVDEQTAITALAAEHQGFPIEDIIAQLQSYSQEQAQ